MPILVPLSSFIGRDQEIAQLAEILVGARLLTLTGAAGIGKTRLSLQVANTVASANRIAVQFADVSVVNEREQVTHVVADALSVAERSGRMLVDVLIDACNTEPQLLVLDNCEHVLDDCASLADLLLSACPTLRILATGRRPLALTGEVVWTVQGLSLPPANTTYFDKTHSQSDAMQLSLTVRVLRDRISPARMKMLPAL